jgi:hypothetical protein
MNFTKFRCPEGTSFAASQIEFCAIIRANTVQELAMPVPELAGENYTTADRVAENFSGGHV